MLYVDVVAILAFVLLACAVSVIVMPKVREELYLDKRYLEVSGDICSSAGAIWFFAPIVTGLSAWWFIPFIIISLFFFHFTARFYLMAHRLK